MTTTRDRRGTGVAALVALMLAVLVALALPAAGAGKPAPKLDVNPAKGSPGDVVELSGKGFAPSSRVTVELLGFERTFFDTLTTDENGAFHGFATLPAVQRGRYEIVATDPAGNTDSAPFKVRKVKPLVAPLIVGPDAGGAPEVRLFASDGTPTFAFQAYSPTFGGGVRVAGGDVDGDRVSDIITGAGPGGGPHVKVLSGRDRSTLASFFAFDPGFQGGVFVAAGDVNHDGKDDIIVAAGPGGGPHVKVFDGGTNELLMSFFAYDAQFIGGVRVAAGDVNGDGRADIITAPGAGAGPHVKAFSGADGSLLRSFFAYDTVFAGGVYVAAGDVNGDGRADIITGAGVGAGPHVKAFSGSDGALLASFFAYAPAFQGGVRVAVGDVNGDGRGEIVTGPGPGGAPNVNVFDGRTAQLRSSFFAYDPAFLGGIYVGVH